MSINKELLRRNFNRLIETLNINLSQLCQYTNYDASAIYRIRNGTRKPSDAVQFASAVASFVVREMQTPPELEVIADLLECDAVSITDRSVCHLKLQNWLLEQQIPDTRTDSIANFLSKLDTFDLNEYINIIKLDDLKVPSSPFQIPTNKTYFGIDEMMESELDFLKATVLSKSMYPVTMYSDMPMKEKARNQEFSKKWLLGMVMMLKKGLHLNQIHNIDRSFDEMMLGLEAWIPMYMTGQISPYYFKNIQNNVFLHSLNVSGTVALSGEAVAGHYVNGKNYLTKSKREVKYYQARADEMLQNAYPLMDIYRSEQENEFNGFITSDTDKPGSRRSILSTLPLYTISGGLLDRILSRHGLDEAQKERIVKHVEMLKQRTVTILQNNTIEDEIPYFTKEVLKENPPSLELSGLFYGADIQYTEDEYLEHFHETETFAAQNPNYKLSLSEAHAFRNLQIFIHEGSFVIVSKGKAPAIHFVIHHPKLRHAIENFIPPILL